MNSIELEKLAKKYFDHAKKAEEALLQYKGETGKAPELRDAGKAAICTEAEYKAILGHVEKNTAWPLNYTTLGTMANKRVMSEDHPMRQNDFSALASRMLTAGVIDIVKLKGTKREIYLKGEAPKGSALMEVATAELPKK